MWNVCSELRSCVERERRAASREGGQRAAIEERKRGSADERGFRAASRGDGSRRKEVGGPPESELAEDAFPESEETRSGEAVARAPGRRAREGVVGVRFDNGEQTELPSRLLSPCTPPESALHLKQMPQSLMRAGLRPGIAARHCVRRGAESRTRLSLRFYHTLENKQLQGRERQQCNLTRTATPGSRAGNRTDSGYGCESVRWIAAFLEIRGHAPLRFHSDMRPSFEPRFRGAALAASAPRREPIWVFRRAGPGAFLLQCTVHRAGERLGSVLRAATVQCAASSVSGGSRSPFDCTSRLGFLDSERRGDQSARVFSLFGYVAEDTGNRAWGACCRCSFSGPRKKCAGFFPRRYTDRRCVSPAKRFWHPAMQNEAR